MIKYIKSLFTSKPTVDDNKEIEDAIRKFHHRNSQGTQSYINNNVDEELEAVSDVVTALLINVAYDNLTNSESCDILDSSESDWSGGGGDFSGGGADGNF